MEDIEYLFKGLPVSPLFYTGHYHYNFAYFLILSFILLACSSLLPKRKEQFFVAAFILGIFTFKSLFILLNEQIHLFPRKPAGNISIWFYILIKEQGLDAVRSIRTGETFYPQLLINFPVFELFGASRLNLLLTNCFLTSIGPIIAFYYTYIYFNKYASYIILLGLSLFPAAINFSFFGLRDPVIYFGIIINITSILLLYKRRNLLDAIWFLLSAMLIIYSRPELIAFIFMPFFFGIFIYVKRNYQNIFSLSKKVFFTQLIFFLFVLPTLLLSTVGFKYISGQIGGYSSPLEVLKKGSEVRYQREIRKRGSKGAMGSHILPPNLYSKLPWYGRWIVQTIGMIILPFPWLVTNITKVFALVDSVFVCFFIYSFLWIRRRLVLSEKVIYNAMYYTFIASLLIMGMIIINAGNAFRMRLAVAPYIIIPAAIYIGHYFTQKRKREAIN